MYYLKHIATWLCKNRYRQRRGRMKVVMGQNADVSQDRGALARMVMTLLDCWWCEAILIVPVVSDGCMEIVRECFVRPARTGRDTAKRFQKYHLVAPITGFIWWSFKAGENFAVFNPAVFSHPKQTCQLTYRLEAGQVVVEKHPGKMWWTVEYGKFFVKPIIRSTESFRVFAGWWWPISRTDIGRE